MSHTQTVGGGGGGGEGGLQTFKPAVFVLYRERLFFLFGSWNAYSEVNLERLIR